MTIWSWIHFISFVIQLSLFAYILGRGTKNYLNWAAAVLMLCFAIWSFGNTMMFNNFSTIKSSNVILRIGALGWIFFSSVSMVFILELIGKRNISRSPVILFILFLIPFFIYITYFIGLMVQCCDKTFFGYTGRWLDTIWAKLFYIYYSSFFLIGMFFLIKYIMQENNSTRRNISVILAATMIFCFITGTISSVILKATRQYVPVEANVYILVFAAGIVYSMIKYDFLTVTTVRATNLILNTMNDALILLNNEGKAIDVNKAAFEIFECDKIKIQDCEHILPEYLIQKIKDGIKNNGVIVNEEVRILTPKDNEKTILLSASVLKNKEQILGYVCILKDITELKLAKSELEATVEKLINSNKELEQFAYIISHDLKEPLRMVSSYVQLLEKRYKDKLDSDANDFIQYAVDGAKHMSELIEGLLDYSRVLTKEMEIEEVNLKQVLEEVLSVLKFKIEEKKAQIVLKSDMPVIKANKINISRVFQNLIDNGIKFCKQNPVIEITSEQKDGFYYFSIKDNGIGIKSEHKFRIFEIFQRLNPRTEYEGAGLGLAICKKIIERHGGKIWIESEGEGRGCVFYFTVPE